MYLIDTNVISELRKAGRAHAGVRAFFETAREAVHPLYLSVITVGELRRGVEQIRYRGDLSQAQLLDTWLQGVLTDYQANILPFGPEAAQVWGRLRVPHPQHELDKQIAATALVYGLTVVTRNSADFADCGVPLLNPFLDA
ncbi:type II toxin-antitoxin system VapC family toxin [Ideonella sp.]|jgi:predicted nucleic acid-binding protein|uniref:type II toxin-antitoxin system VapC family toxin n=1 Tax=Ideonella sp. TaxID=1929293 RepID=UPI0037BE586D